MFFTKYNNNNLCYTLFRNIREIKFKKSYKFGLIDWCLMPTLAVFQLYRGVNTFYINLRQLQNP
jgi:hypothetical protein